MAKKLKRAARPRPSAGKKIYCTLVLRIPILQTIRDADEDWLKHEEEHYLPHAADAALAYARTCEVGEALKLGAGTWSLE